MKITGYHNGHEINAYLDPAILIAINSIWQTNKFSPPGTIVVAKNSQGVIKGTPEQVISTLQGRLYAISKLEGYDG